MDLIVISDNPNSRKRYKTLLEPLGFNICSMSDKGIYSDIEKGKTFEEKAYYKADSIKYLTDAYILSEYCGIEVDGNYICYICLIDNVDEEHIFKRVLKEKKLLDGYNDFHMSSLRNEMISYLKEKENEKKNN